MSARLTKTTMLRTSLNAQLNDAALSRAFSVSRSIRQADPPPSNKPPTQAGTQGYSPSSEQTKPSDQKQSSASSAETESKSGDDHPAKQPDNQAEPERSTGFQGAREVKGGKEGLGDRTDK
ncbi:hypothetical protein LTS18_004689 [Coniosporium uncinatum]|uniref:Uncharacterized protein n=1 Tax=Coniosporium uncinatum TaxID=93489 RepID=A0ACC3DXZ6_9PEZI|nr:hypothetical protein LTS18_004689 [Coniosporium uncinatum]